MSHLDPLGDGFHDRSRPDDLFGWERSDSGDDTRVRARHIAAPDAYPRHVRRGDHRYGSPDPYDDTPSTGRRPHHSAEPPDPWLDRYRDDGFNRHRQNGRGRSAYGVSGEPEPVAESETEASAEVTAALPTVDPVEMAATLSAADPTEMTAALPLVGAPPASYRGRHRAGRRRAAGSGRAGRNLPAAIGVGLALAAGILVPLFLLRPAFFAVIAVAVSVGIWEMVRALRARDTRTPIVPLIAGGLLMVGLAWRSGLDGLGLGLLVTVVAVLVWRLADGPAGYQRDATAGVLVAVYVPFLAGFAALLTVPPDGAWRVLVTLAAVVLSDTGGYVVGVFLGRHPMAPSVSPKKSWEGFAGSIGSAAIGSALLLSLVLDVDLWLGALFGLGVSAAAVLGDLCESMIKRDLGIKDMSNLLPGHGGLMDRLDSILFAVPTSYLLLAIILPAG